MLSYINRAFCRVYSGPLSLDMSCDLCQHGSHVCQGYNRHPNFEHPHYADVPDDVDEEPEAPTLSLGNRILWLTETRAASGIVRWIGRIRAISAGWSAGIEFDNVMPNGGNGDFRGRNFFASRPGHALFLSVSDLIKVDSAPSSSNGERTFFGRLQDSCSNFAHRRRRDSTFGHFKQDYVFA
ncbi:ranBP-type and C3HC4-type zinc finger-containing protein 1 [Caerostris darwini]|uniref:RanBP-type and C3HC4-type zinc finger-containing protein 1 n=1 Tax=Caerostris darwini TaxID=1538125 RepID=A0AAV4UX83_9ARAC|nr:ranBP-type and C3HC4-type zinc finger-containing protein 1 [Caerostris darwini]